MRVKSVDFSDELELDACYSADGMNYQESHLDLELRSDMAVYEFKPSEQFSIIEPQLKVQKIKDITKKYHLGH